MTLICLISGQLTPNLFSVILEKPDRVVLVHTQDTEEEASHFSGFIQKNYGVEETRKVLVKPFNPAEIKISAQALANELMNDGSDLSQTVLNYTGGTKPMAIQFVEVFTRAGAKAVYVDTQQERCWWTINEAITEVPFSLKLNIPELLALKSADILDQTDENIIDTLSGLSQYLFESRDQNTDDALNQWLRKTVQVQLNMPRSNVDTYLNKWNPALSHPVLSVGNKVVSKHFSLPKMDVTFKGSALPNKKKSFWLTYFTGAWFEFYVFEKLKQTGAYNDIRCNLRLKTQAEQQQVKNEVDVIALKNGIPVFVECKTGWVNQKSITNLKAVADTFGGRYCEMVLVSLNDSIDDTIHEKIREYGIHLISGAENLNRELEAMHEWMVVKK